MRKKRCNWVPQDDPLYLVYHDQEWGVPLHDEVGLFEALILDGFQAGLSWRTVLYKRENFRKAFDGFDFEKIARYKEKKMEKLLGDPGIIRNRLKVHAAVNNAQRYMEVRREFGSFDNYLWGFVAQKTLVNRFKKDSEVPASTPLSDTVSADLKKRGFKFVGSTIIYAFMQAVGLVNDHLVSCFRYKEVGRL